MKIAFISNYYNHHQHSLSRELMQLTGGEYRFVATSEMRQERKQLGYGHWEIPEYVYTSYTSREDALCCRKIVKEADVLLIGAAPEKLYRGAKKEQLLWFYTERLLKQEKITLRQCLGMLKKRLRYSGRKHTGILCAGAYVAEDFARFGAFHGKTFKWGYFPETKQYPDFSRIMEAKEPRSILWAGRFLDWKHPELTLEVAARLKRQGSAFRLRLVGSGAMEEQLRRMVQQWELEDCVEFLGSMRPDEVRTYMEKSEIFLFTSDRQEGWGAVLNEAMNSGCAVVASHAIGSVPYLIRDGENGLVFDSGDGDDLYRHLCYLLEHPSERSRLGYAANETILKTWNAEVAARRLTELSRWMLTGGQKPCPYTEGPCSPADVISMDRCKKIHD